MNEAMASEQALADVVTFHASLAGMIASRSFTISDKLPMCAIEHRNNECAWRRSKVTLPLVYKDELRAEWQA